MRRNAARRAPASSRRMPSHSCWSRTPGSVPSGARDGSPTRLAQRGLSDLPQHDPAGRLEVRAARDRPVHAGMRAALGVRDAAHRDARREGRRDWRDGHRTGGGGQGRATSADGESSEVPPISSSVLQPHCDAPRGQSPRSPGTALERRPCTGGSRCPGRCQAVTSSAPDSSRCTTVTSGPALSAPPLSNAGQVSRRKHPGGAAPAGLTPGGGGVFEAVIGKYTAFRRTAVGVRSAQSTETSRLSLAGHCGEPGELRVQGHRDDPRLRRPGLGPGVLPGRPSATTPRTRPARRRGTAVGDHHCRSGSRRCVDHARAGVAGGARRAVGNRQQRAEVPGGTQRQQARGDRVDRRVTLASAAPGTATQGGGRGGEVPRDAHRLAPRAGRARSARRARRGPPSHPSAGRARSAERGGGVRGDLGRAGSGRARRRSPRSRGNPARDVDVASSGYAVPNPSANARNGSDEAGRAAATTAATARSRQEGALRTVDRARVDDQVLVVRRQGRSVDALDPRDRLGPDLLEQRRVVGRPQGVTCVRCWCRGTSRAAVRRARTAATPQTTGSTARRTGPWPRSCRTTCPATGRGSGIPTRSSFSQSHSMTCCRARCAGPGCGR